MTLPLKNGPFSGDMLIFPGGGGKLRKVFVLHPSEAQIRKLQSQPEDAVQESFLMDAIPGKIYENMD